MAFIAMRATALEARQHLLRRRKCKKTRLDDNFGKKKTISAPVVQSGFPIFEKSNKKNAAAENLSLC